MCALQSSRRYRGLSCAKQPAWRGQEVAEIGAKRTEFSVQTERYLMTVEIIAPIGKDGILFMQARTAIHGDVQRLLDIMRFVTSSVT